MSYCSEAINEILKKQVLTILGANKWKSRSASEYFFSSRLIISHPAGAQQHISPPPPPFDLFKLAPDIS